MILGIDNDESDDGGEYVAYCFNEACAYIMAKKADGHEPVYTRSSVLTKKYKSFSDFYEKIT